MKTEAIKKWYTIFEKTMLITAITVAILSIVVPLLMAVLWVVSSKRCTVEFS